MKIHLKEVLSTAFTQAALKRRLVLLSLVYLGVAAMLVGLEFQQRLDVIASAKISLAAFARLTDEQTTRTIKSTEETLERASAQLATATEAGKADTASIQATFRELLASRPFLKQIVVLDRQGRTVFTSGGNEPGLDLSDRAFFAHQRDNPGRGFLLGVPIRGRLTGEWIIPASLALRDADGKFAGIVAVSIDPLFFNGVWTNDQTIPEQATTLWRNDGTVLMRSPFDEASMGRTLTNGVMATRLGVGNGEGTLRAVSLIDGEDRLVAYRRLAAYPEFSIAVTQVTDRALAAWRQTAWMMALGWAAAGAALAWLALGLVRENIARQATQDRYSLIFQANPYSMVVMDAGTRRMLAVNDAAVKEYGWSREEILSMPANDFYAPEDLPALEAMRQTDVGNEYFVVRGLRHRKKDGTVFDVEMHTHAFTLDARPAILTIMENVTVRRSVEAQLRQAQKMEAVGQLTGGIAHDFNNILFVILANTDALEEEERLEAPVVERLAEIAKAVGRASALTRQLLAFSRQQVLNPQQTDLNDLVADTGKLLRRALGAGIEIDLGVSKLVRLTAPNPRPLPKGATRKIERHQPVKPKAYLYVQRGCASPAPVSTRIRSSACVRCYT